ncbi:MAG: hypothetical protein DME40_01280 [Verrucomicrobia bacterium]|nr:MAG: hypothetical protein DME40_01280 [Verrucomicrobiota bacterium]PYL74775.1 MAG: hypothetical protein DMF27_13805 [Verrucomicrobiota bacterium]
MVRPDLDAAYLGTQGDIWDAQKDMASGIRWRDVDRHRADLRFQTINFPRLMSPSEMVDSKFDLHLTKTATQA